MANRLDSVLNFGRKLKGDLVNNYYSYRINTPHQPDRILFRESPFEFIFILSHMRSGSSLLTHLLSANPEILGFGETHVNYRSSRDFKSLLFKLHTRLSDRSMSRRYALDKLLHNNKLLDEQLLLFPGLKIIFLLRDATPSIPSILKLKPHLTEAEAVKYYVTRLAKLEDYANLLAGKQPSLFITHEQLIHQTQPVFDLLQDFLQVEDPFTEEYQILNTTGMKYVGDTSENIKAGRILRTPKQQKVEIAAEVMEPAIAAFNQCQTTLNHLCQTINPPALPTESSDSANH